MWRAIIISVILAGITAACGGDASPAGRAIERIANPTEQAAVDEEEIKDRLDDFGKAFSRENWSDIYDLLPPSSRANCQRGRFLVAIDAALMLRSAFISDEAWEALKDDAADGMEIRSLEIRGNIAMADTLESGEIAMLREDGRWWVLEDPDPCGLLDE